MKVSVVVVTYNHSAYIDEALKSVYGQIAGFDFEVIISEDASTDGTREIVQSWARRHSDRTRLILSERNVRSNEVVRRGFAAARGEYVALLDGDDHWISPHKLARQVAILDQDRTLSLCFHNARVSGGTTPFGDLWTDPAMKPRLTLDDLWFGNPFATCGSLFRREVVRDIPEWYRDFFPITDWPLYILFAEHGDIAFMPEVMGVYRLHAGGMYSAQTASAKLESMDQLYRRMNECTDYRHDAALRMGHRQYFFDWARAYLSAGQPELARLSLEHARGYEAPVGIAGMIEAMALSLRAKFAKQQHSGSPGT